MTSTRGHAAEVVAANEDDIHGCWSGGDARPGRGGRLPGHGGHSLRRPDAVASTEAYPLQAVVVGFGGGAISINCNTFSNSDRVDATNAVVTAITVGSVE